MRSVRSVTTSWTDREQLFEDAVCIHLIRYLRAWRLNSATSAVDVPEHVERTGAGTQGARDLRYLRHRFERATAARRRIR